MAHLLRVRSKHWPFDSNIGRIAYSCDGNEHDSDDWGASALAIAIVAKNHIGNLVHYEYGNHIWSDGGSTFITQSAESNEGGRVQFGLPPGVFFNCRTQELAARAHLTAEVNASSASNPLMILCAGPMETVWQAVNAADSGKRQYVECVSHSTWNETHGQTGGDNEPEHGGHGWTDLDTLGVVTTDIADQNGSGRLGDQLLTNFSYFNTSGITRYQWVYTRLDAVAGGTGTDASDAGLMWYAISGTRDQNVSPAKIQTHLGL